MTAAERAPVEVEIDDAQLRMMQAQDLGSRLLWCKRMTAAIQRRNAARSPEQIAEIERQRGLR